MRVAAGMTVRQQGMSLPGLLVMLLVASLLGSLALKLIPVYLNHYKVVAALESVESQPDWSSLPREALIERLQKHWMVDAVAHVTPRDILLSREGRTIVLRVSYDVTQHWFRNIDLLIHFDDSIEAAPH